MLPSELIQARKFPSRLMHQELSSQPHLQAHLMILHCSFPMLRFYARPLSFLFAAMYSSRFQRSILHVKAASHLRQVPQETADLLCAQKHSCSLPHSGTLQGLSACLQRTCSGRFRILSCCLDHRNLRVSEFQILYRSHLVKANMLLILHVRPANSAVLFYLT